MAAAPTVAAFWSRAVAERCADVAGSWVVRTWKGTEAVIMLTLLGC